MNGKVKFEKSNEFNDLALRNYTIPFFLKNEFEEDLGKLLQLGRQLVWCLDGRELKTNLAINNYICATNCFKRGFVWWYLETVVSCSEVVDTFIHLTELVRGREVGCVKSAVFQIVYEVGMKRWD